MKVQKFKLSDDGLNIRVSPENYLLAQFFPEHRAWIMVPDLACDIADVFRCTALLMIHRLKYSNDGNIIVDLLNVEKFALCNFVDLLESGGML